MLLISVSVMIINSAMKARNPSIILFLSCPHFHDPIYYPVISVLSQHIFVSIPTISILVQATTTSHLTKEMPSSLISVILFPHFQLSFQWGQDTSWFRNLQWLSIVHRITHKQGPSSPACLSPIYLSSLIFHYRRHSSLSYTHTDFSGPRSVMLSPDTGPLYTLFYLFGTHPSSFHLVSFYLPFSSSL